MNPWTRRTLVLLAVVLLSLAAGVAWAAYSARQRYQSALLMLEPRLQRLAGLVSAGAEIQAKRDQAARDISPWLHPKSPNATTEVQQRLRQLIDGAGLTSVALQAAEGDASDAIARVRLVATVTGAWPAALRLLQTLSQQRPVFWIQSLQIMREGRDTPTDAQTVRLTLQIDAPVAREAAP